MHYLLDSNILIFVIKDPECIVSKRLRATVVADVAICSVVEGELYHGAKKVTIQLQDVVFQKDYLMHVDI